MVNRYTVCQEKSAAIFFASNFAKCWLIFSKNFHMPRSANPAVAELLLPLVSEYFILLLAIFMALNGP